MHRTSKTKERMQCYKKRLYYKSIKIQKIGYEWYVVRNFDPINALQLNKKVRVVRYQRVALCNFMKAQQIRYGWYVIKNYPPRI